MGKCVLRSLSLSFQKKNWQVGPQQSFFWYDTYWKIKSVKAAEYNFVVGVIPKEGVAGPCPPILLWVWQRKDLKAHFLVTRTAHISTNLKTSSFREFIDRCCRVEEEIIVPSNRLKVVEGISHPVEKRKKQRSLWRVSEEHLSSTF